MKIMNKKLLILLFGILMLSLSACGPIRDVIPGLGDSGQPSDGVGDAEDAAGFMDALREAGVEVETAGSIEQPFFPVTGQVIMVNGSQVQVFEFADGTTRSQVSDTISASGDQIGTFMPSWIERPNFWADGRLIVLYVGQEQSLIEIISNVLGDPITEAGEAGELPPQAVLEGQRVLAEELGVGVGEVELIEVERMDWSDSCLGLGGPAESCLAAITPGWQVIFEVNGQLYEVRTDESGEAIRWHELDHLPPQAVLEGQRVLADELGIETSSIELIEVAQMDWSDSCLGLGRPDESCLAAITTGWQAIFEVNGQRYEVRTDENGESIRWRELGETPIDDVGTPDSSSQVFMYLISLESKGDEAGIGCGDSLVAVEIESKDEIQPIRSALSQLLAVDEQFYGDSRSYNALYQSDLQVDSVMLDSSGTATINLSGDIIIEGECDVPRVEAQLEMTALQFESVSSAVIYLNGKPLEQVLVMSDGHEQKASHEGVSFTYSSTLAENVNGETVPASTTLPQVPFIREIPEHKQFEFSGYRDENSSIKPQILVISVDKLRETQPGAGNLIALLHTIMSIRPELLFDYLTLLPFVDTSNMMFAQVRELEFQNGTGVRFLTQYDPGEVMINNQQLFYTFQGLTDDGNTYIAAVLPTSHPDLPDTADNGGSLGEDYSEYMEEITNHLDSESETSFTPELSTLDTMIMSLEIQK